MRSVTLTIGASAVGILLAAGPLSAHHSFAADYFEDQQISIQGTVVAFEYRNPHSWVHVLAKDDRGVLQTYAAEWSAPARLTRDGLTPHSLEPGDRVVVSGSPGRHPIEHRLRLKAIERPADGWAWPKHQ
jgi:hypothetical protein